MSIVVTPRRRHGHLEQSDVQAAASLLRYFLEYIGGELCHRLRAFVEFRGDAQYQLGDVLPRATGQLRELYEKGKRAATSWGQAEVVKGIRASAGAFSKAVKQSNVEQWQINPAVHYNEWASLQREDFMPVVKAFRDLVETFQCPKCQGYLYVIPERGSMKSLRCDCSHISINLVEKGKT